VRPDVRSRIRATVLLVLLAFAACAGDAGRSLALLDYEAVVPPTWVARPATSSMRLSEFDVPRTDGTQAEVVVYYFGPGQGGSADANIARWSAQFTGPDGSEVTPHVMAVDGTPFTTTVAEFEGAYARGVGMGSAEAVPGQGLVAAVVETPQGNLFFQLFGDRAAVAATREDFLAFVTSVRPSGGASDAQEA
jgi:hypothetical protein